MRRALVTGITGQTGSYLAESLTAHGWEVHGAVRTVGEEARSGAPELHVADLTRPDEITTVIERVRPDAVFHLGGLTSVAESWADPAAYAVTVGGSTAAILAAAKRLTDAGHEVRVVNASSAEVFGRAVDQPQTARTAIAPVTPYGAAKALGHHLVQMYRAGGLPAANGILYNHESPRRPLAFVTRKITHGVAQIAAGRAETLTLGNLDARRDWGWAPDYAEALRLAADAPDDYIIATGVSHSVRDFVAAAFAAVGIDDWQPLVRQDPRFMRPNDAPEQRGDPSATEAALGWRRTVGFEELVAAMVAADLAALDEGATSAD
ncbi:GDP-mannose 4,6-dehydratase [Microcella frigidaquae]|uniref:GDP-mannose 4,6-dehydratase n=1 Tax=Microcella frigidaquae TaxID=424758 RepID=A0A840XBJ4_9MICO|nr:GDP-mannose 4,6-dehydratase [Microcella frigidaquae]MBB5618524.1 GDPmannose 4,6-dehydratase [Microcella frigidaquae]NHN44577.1 GDP-mannose 4,6-dehydratase [Microcella frigidaquae]